MVSILAYAHRVAMDADTAYMYRDQIREHLKGLRKRKRHVEFGNLSVFPETPEGLDDTRKKFAYGDTLPPAVEIMLAVAASGLGI